MLELTSLGHATLLVRSAVASILCDPILGDAVSGGGNVVRPPRTVHVEGLPALDAILISHHHSDHFSIGDLALIPRIRDQRIFAPEGSSVIDELRRFGCSRVEPLHVSRPFLVGDISVVPTPSAVDFPEVGFLFRSNGISALNLVDSQIHGMMDSILAITKGAVDLVLAPFQAGGYMSLLPLRVGGAPLGLKEAILRWSEEYTEEIVADLALIKPRFVVPFADGLLYRDEGINSWHFPLSDEVFLDRMARFGIAGCSCAPGIVFAVSSSGVEIRTSTSRIIGTESGQGSTRAFNPNVSLRDVPMSCADWNPALKTDEPEGNLADQDELLKSMVESNLSAALQSTDEASVTDRVCNWFLEFCDRPECMKYLYVDRSGESFWVRLGDERPALREYGIRLHRKDLLHLLHGRILLEHITLGGAFRYHSPREVDDLERIRGRVLGPFYTILGLN